MKTIILLLGLTLCSGCVISRPVAIRWSTGTNGIITRERLSLTTIAWWPATSSIEKQTALAGKVLSLGQMQADLATGGTNVVAALHEIDNIISHIPK